SRFAGGDGGSLGVAVRTPRARLPRLRVRRDPAGGGRRSVRAPEPRRGNRPPPRLPRVRVRGFPEPPRSTLDALRRRRARLHRPVRRARRGRELRLLAPSSSLGPDRGRRLHARPAVEEGRGEPEAGSPDDRLRRRRAGPATPDAPRELSIRVAEPREVPP